jgi:hypothetical protein
MKRYVVCRLSLVGAKERRGRLLVFFASEAGFHTSHDAAPVQYR